MSSPAINPVAATLLLIGLTSTAYADFTGKVVNVADGDTITVLRDRTQVKVIAMSAGLAFGQVTGSGFFITTDGYFVTNEHVGACHSGWALPTFCRLEKTKAAFSGLPFYASFCLLADRAHIPIAKWI